MVGASLAEFERAMICATHIGWSRRGTRRGANWWTAQEARCQQKAVKSPRAWRRAAKSGADMARLYNVSQPTVPRIVAEHLSGRD